MMMSNNSTSLGTQLLLHAKHIGFDDAAVVSAHTLLPEYEHFQEAMESGRFATLPYMQASAHKRANIFAKLDSAHSVLAVMLNYFPGDHQDVEASATSTSGPQALVSRYAWGRDYHHVMRRLLRKLRNHLLTLEPSAIVAPFSDENAVLNRAWTRAAGLGFIGKNTMLIHRELGSWTFLGGLITSADLLTNTVIRPAQHSLCGTCDKCMKACPTQAIQAPFILDGNRCISTWNIENPTPPINKDEDRVKGHGWAFGCDICQEICPWNKFEKTTSHEAFQAKPGHIQWDTHSLPKELIGSPIRRAGEEQLFQLTTRALDGRHMTHRRIKRTERLNRM